MKKSINILTVTSILLSTMSTPQLQAYPGQGIVNAVSSSISDTTSYIKTSITSTPGAQLSYRGAQNLTAGTETLLKGGYAGLEAMSQISKIMNQISKMQLFFGTAATVSFLVALYSGALVTYGPTALSLVKTAVPTALNQIVQLYQKQQYVPLALITIQACRSAHVALMGVHFISSAVKSIWNIGKGLVQTTFGAAELAIGVPTFAVCGTAKLGYNTTVTTYNMTAYAIGAINLGQKHLMDSED